jgi:hypothetical protein
VRGDEFQKVECNIFGAARGGERCDFHGVRIPLSCYE